MTPVLLSQPTTTVKYATTMSFKVVRVHLRHGDVGGRKYKKIRACATDLEQKSWPCRTTPTPCTDTGERYPL